MAGCGGRTAQKAQFRLIAAPSRASAARRSSSSTADRVSATFATDFGSSAREGAGPFRRDSGACRSASRPTALQPKKRLTRCSITSDECWISSAAGPSTRKISVAGSCGCPSTGRGHCIFSGSEWAAISAPAMSAQRVTSSRAAKPCLAKASEKTSLSRTERGFAEIGPGFAMGALYLQRPSGSRRARPYRLQVAVNLTSPLHQVVVHLQAKKESFRETEIAREPKVGIGGDVSLAQNNFVDAAWRHMNGTRQPVLAEPHRLEELLKQDFAGMRVLKKPALSRGSRRFRHVSVLPHSRRNRCATGR